MQSIGNRFNRQKTGVVVTDKDYLKTNSYNRNRECNRKIFETITHLWLEATVKRVANQASCPLPPSSSLFAALCWFCFARFLRTRIVYFFSVVLGLKFLLLRR